MRKFIKPDISSAMFFRLDKLERGMSRDWVHQNRLPPFFRFNCSWIKSLKLQLELTTRLSSPGLIQFPSHSQELFQLPEVLLLRLRLDNTAPQNIRGLKIRNGDILRYILRRPQKRNSKTGSGRAVLYRSIFEIFDVKGFAVQPNRT